MLNAINTSDLQYKIVNNHNLIMADDRRISNQEAFERYVMMFRSNMEAARRFMNDEGIMNEAVSFNRWVYHFRSRRSRWAKLNKQQKSISTNKSFLEFQQEGFF